MRLRTLGTGPPVVKLAGLAGGIGLYQEEMATAARAGFEVVALDTAGDRRDDPAPGPVTWDFLVSEVRAGLDALEIPRAVLWGTSFGCLVALASSARMPERVSGLLLCHPPDPTRRSRYERSLLGWAGRRRDPAEAARRVFILWFRLLAGWEALYPTVLGRLPALARATWEAATPASTFRDKLRLLAEEPPGYPPAEADIPVSIVAGAWDAVTPLSEVRSLAARLPDARLSVLGFAGHAGAYSRPRAYAQLVIRELQRLHGIGNGSTG